MLGKLSYHIGFFFGKLGKKLGMFLGVVTMREKYCLDLSHCVLNAVIFSRRSFAM